MWERKDKISISSGWFYEKYSKHAHKSNGRIRPIQPVLPLKPFYICDKRIEKKGSKNCDGHFTALIYLCQYSSHFIALYFTKCENCAAGHLIRPLSIHHEFVCISYPSQMLSDWIYKSKAYESLILLSNNVIDNFMAFYMNIVR